MGDRESVAEREYSELLNTVHDVLSSPDRRSVLKRLVEDGGPVDLGHLAAEVAAARSGVAAERLSPGQRDAALVGLVHVHLPKLRDTGFVEWDRETDTVTIAPMVEELSSKTPAAGSLVEVSIAPRERPEE